MDGSPRGSIGCQQSRGSHNRGQCRAGDRIDHAAHRAGSSARSVAGPASIRYGLGAIKGVGQSAVEALIEERNAHGPFSTLPDLCRRVDLQRVNRRVFEALIRSGSLDRIGPNRATLTAELDRAMHAGEQNSRAMSVGQVDLFGVNRLDRAVAGRVRCRNQR